MCACLTRGHSAQATHNKLNANRVVRRRHGVWVSLREGVVATADAAGDLEARSLREDGEARKAGPEQHEQRTWLGLG